MIYAPKGSKGRNTRSAGKVPEVETLPCGKRLHRLSNRVEFREAVTRCDHCGHTWAELDAAARAAVPVRKGRAA